MSQKFWVYLVAIMGITLIICGVLAREPVQPGSDGKCEPNTFSWAPVIIGALMALMGIGTLWQMRKAGGVGAMAAAPPPDMGGDMGGAM